MNLAIIGCGYVAEFYGKTLSNYPELKLVGAFDRNEANLKSFCYRWPVHTYGSFDQLLADTSVEMVLNLTNPRSHFEVTKRCLEAGKHVYSEKPLAMNCESAIELLRIARERGVYLSSAPCSVLSETAQTLQKAIRDELIGKVRLVYANFDDGMIAPTLSPWNWRNGCGVPWPAKDEFEVGCTYEHAGYVLTWLAACFGPAKGVTAFAACQIPDKGIPVEHMAPDFTVGCIEYGNGLVARVTCSFVAPNDKSITIIGDDGILSVLDVRNDLCPVYFQPTPARGIAAGVERRVNRFRRLLHWPRAEIAWHYRKKLTLAQRHRGRLVSDSKPVDFCRGPAELASAIRERRRCRLSAELGVHVVEIIEALQHPERHGGRRQLISLFPPICPLTEPI